MSRYVITKLGRFRIIKNAAPLFECPCGEWLNLSEDQANGRVSVDHASMGCPEKYHETHDYQAELRATIVVRKLSLENPTCQVESCIRC